MSAGSKAGRFGYGTGSALENVGNISHNRRTRVTMDHYRYSVSDPVDPRFHATAVIEDEELLIEIRTELESGERSAVLNGPDQLRKILAHFCPRYKSIRTSWWFGDNLATFNRATAAGATPQEAAVRTALGHQLALAGFSRALVRSLEGSPARYTKIVVTFIKP